MPPSWVWTLGEPLGQSKGQKDADWNSEPVWADLPKCKTKNSVLDSKKVCVFFYVFSVIYSYKIQAVFLCFGFFVGGKILHFWTYPLDLYTPPPRIPVSNEELCKVWLGWLYPQKPHMAMENGPFEDVVLIEKGIFQCHVRFQEGSHKLSRK